MQVDVAALTREMDRTRKLYSYRPYGHPDTLEIPGWSRKPWQLDFINAGATHSQRMLMAANRVGKTDTASAEVAHHAIGDYPEWWEGRCFSHAPLIWVGSVTNEASRDITQKALLGGLGEQLGSGWIPKDRIVGKPSIRQAGISDVVDTVKVRHKSGDIAIIVFKSYDQGWRKWQGTAPDVVWLDEEPDATAANEAKIFSEALTRILSTRGVLMVTFTPLLGETDLVRHFHKGLDATFLIGATWEDAPHLGEKEKRELRESYEDYDLETRTMGVPMLGSGRVWTCTEKEIACDPFEIPAHYARIAGIDFGIDHYFGYAQIAWDRDKDIIYLTDAFKMKGREAVWHAEAINRRATWIPIAWPHDGVNKEKGSGKQLWTIYSDHGVNMLPRSAHYPANPGEKPKLGSQPVEPIVLEFLERMKSQRFKVFRHCADFFDEFRSYHRKDGKINPVNDDVTKALFYAAMMKRYGVAHTIRRRQVPTVPTMSVSV